MAVLAPAPRPPCRKTPDDWPFFSPGGMKITRSGKKMIMRPGISDKFPVPSNGHRERDHYENYLDYLHAEDEEKCSVAGYLKQFIFWPGRMSGSLPGFGQQPELFIYPVVAGNQHLYNEFMCWETNRFATFVQLPALQIFVTKVARNGFYVENGTILCFACGGVHPHHTGTCARNNENIPFSFCFVPAEAPFQAACLNVTLRAQGMATQQSNEAVMTGVNIQLRSRFWQESGGLADLHGTSRGGRPGRCPGLNSRTGSSHPDYCLPLQRQRSFESVPQLAHLASRLAQRGFFAVNSRVVACWVCGEQILVADL